jgi:hypothetical protein
VALGGVLAVLYAAWRRQRVAGGRASRRAG